MEGTTSLREQTPQFPGYPHGGAKKKRTYTSSTADYIFQISLHTHQSLIRRLSLLIASETRSNRPHVTATKLTKPRPRFNTNARKETAQIAERSGKNHQFPPGRARAPQKPPTEARPVRAHGVAPLASNATRPRARADRLIN